MVVTSLDIALNKYIDMYQASVSHSIDEVTNGLNHPEISDQWVEFTNNFEKLNRIENSMVLQYGYLLHCLLQLQFLYKY